MIDSPWNFRATVNGRDLTTAGTFAVRNPATGVVIAVAPAVAAEQLDGIYADAESAFETWKLDDEVRRDAMRRSADAIEGSLAELARVLTAEQGKPLAESEQELGASIGWLRYYAEIELPREVVRDDAERFEEIIHRPIGVTSAIVPWNYPIVLAMWKIAPALRAGCTLVVKPSPYTPLTTLALGEVLRGVLPNGVLNVVSGEEPLGAAMVAHPGARKVTFTGSTAIGRKVGAVAGENLKSVTLELGGNDPAVVLDDVDVNTIAQSLFWSAFSNNGQICIAVKRIYVHRSLHSELVDALADIATSAKVGDGAEPGTQLGPINNQPQLTIVEDLVDDAVRSGARIAAGGRRLPGNGFFYAPTIVDRVSDGVRIVDEEQFGPALPIIAIDDDADGIRRANRGNFGLTASVWSADKDRAQQVARNIDAGQVSINSHMGAVLPHLPFSGHKWSGLGVENGKWGLAEFTQMQVIAVPRDAVVG